MENGSPRRSSCRTTEYLEPAVSLRSEAAFSCREPAHQAKLDRITTHDAITYSYKAEKHKAITPYVRYGIMIGEREHYPLPGRLFRHGTNFDFMFSFKGDTPDGTEWESFVALVQREVLYSRQTEEMLHESRSPGRKRYYMMEKQLVLAEMTEAEAELGRDLKPEDWL